VLPGLAGSPTGASDAMRIGDLDPLDGEGELEVDLDGVGAVRGAAPDPLVWAERMENDNGGGEMRDIGADDGSIVGRTEGGSGKSEEIVILVHWTDRKTWK
jgi:hypothetical protein